MYRWMGQFRLVGQVPLHGTVTCGWTGILIGDVIMDVQRFTTGDVYYGTQVIYADTVDIWTITCNGT